MQSIRYSPPIVEKSPDHTFPSIFRTLMSLQQQNGSQSSTHDASSGFDIGRGIRGSGSSSGSRTCSSGRSGGEAGIEGGAGLTDEAGGGWGETGDGASGVGKGGLDACVGGDGIESLCETKCQWLNENDFKR